MMARVRNRGEEEGDELGPNSSDPMYDEEEGFEEEGDELEGDTEAQDGKGTSNPLWNYVTKLERCCGDTNLPNISAKQRRKYIQIEEVVQQKNQETKNSV